MIVITGASSGIGRDLAKIFIEENKSDELILISRRDPILPDAKWLKVDLRDTKQIKDLSQSLKDFNQNCDLLVHCAGVMRSNPSNKINLDDAVESYMVNSIAPLFITSALSRSLAKAKGTVISISSIASELDIPGEAIYSSTKAALNKGIDSLSADLSRLGICFLKIKPSLIDTPMTEHLNESQKNYMTGCQSTKLRPSSLELANYIASLYNTNHFITGSDIFFGGIRR